MACLCPHTRTNCSMSLQYERAPAVHADTLKRFDTSPPQDSRSSKPCPQSRPAYSDSGDRTRSINAVCANRSRSARLSPCPSLIDRSRKTSLQPHSYAHVHADCCTSQTPPGSASHRTRPYAAGATRKSDSDATASQPDEPRSCELPIEIRKQIRHLIHPNPVSVACGILPVKPLPDRRSQYSPRRLPRLKLRNLEIQMPVVIHAHHLALQNLLHLFQVHHKPAHRIDLTRNRHLQRVIVPMPVTIRALAKDPLVLLRQTTRRSSNNAREENSALRVRRTIVDL